MIDIRAHRQKMTGDEPDAKAILPKRGASRKQIPISSVSVRDERGDQQQRGDGGEDVLLARHLPIRPVLCGVDNPWPRW